MGRFEPGHKKLGGRKRGTPNAKTQALEGILSGLGKSVPEMILEILPDLDPSEKVKVLMGLMPYIYPKRKAIEIESEPMDPIRARVYSMSPEQVTAEIERIQKINRMIEEAENDPTLIHPGKEGKGTDSVDS